VTWPANHPASDPAKRATTPYPPDDTPGRPPRRHLPPDWFDDPEPVESVGWIRTPLAPDGQPPRGVQRARPPAPRAETPRRRRRGSAARRLAVRLTDRDGAILTDLARFGALTAEQVGRRHFASVRTAYGRLKALARAGYLELVRVWHGRPGAYVATAEGARVADVALPRWYAGEMDYGGVRWFVTEAPSAHAWPV
jgi:hypothetical protein